MHQLCYRTGAPLCRHSHIISNQNKVELFSSCRAVWTILWISQWLSHPLSWFFRCNIFVILLSTLFNLKQTKKNPHVDENPTFVGEIVRLCEPLVAVGFPISRPTHSMYQVDVMYPHYHRICWLIPRNWLVKINHIPIISYCFLLGGSSHLLSIGY